MVGYMIDSIRAYAAGRLAFAIDNAPATRNNIDAIRLSIDNVITFTIDARMDNKSIIPPVIAEIFVLQKKQRIKFAKTGTKMRNGAVLPPLASATTPAHMKLHIVPGMASMNAMTPSSIGVAVFVFTNTTCCSLILVSFLGFVLHNDPPQPDGKSLNSEKIPTFVE